MDVIAGRYGKILLLPCHMDGPPSKNVFSVFVSSGRKFRSDQTSLGPRAVAFSDGLSGVESLNCWGLWPIKTHRQRQAFCVFRYNSSAKPSFVTEFWEKPWPRFCDYFWSVKMISIDWLDAWSYFIQRVRNQVNQLKSFSLIKNNHRTLVKVFFSKFSNSHRYVYSIE